MSEAPALRYFLLRLVRKGPEVGCILARDGEGLRAMIDGQWMGEWRPPPSEDELTDGLISGDQDPHLRAILQILLHGRPVQAREVAYRLSLKEWALAHAPGHPAANPRERIDINKLQPPRF